MKNLILMTRPSERERIRLENRRKACMINYEGEEICIDPTLDLLALIGKKYTMLILGVLGNSTEKKNFNEIIRDIPNSSSTIISKRLKELQTLNLIEKRLISGHINYYLTPLGVEVRKALIPLFRLMAKHSYNDGHLTYSSP